MKLFFSVAALSKMSSRSDCGCRLASSGPVLEIHPGMTQVKGISAMLVALVHVCVMLVDDLEVVNLVMISVELPMC